MPRLHGKLQRDGWPVNDKRVKRLYRLDGLDAAVATHGQPVRRLLDHDRDSVHASR